MANIDVNAGGDFQAALNAAVSGDVIRLAANATFEGNFTVPNKGALAVPIVITTQTNPSLMPAVGYRMQPSYAALLPKLRGTQASNFRSLPCVTFANGARDYTFRFVQWLSNYWGAGEMMQMGSNNSTQNLYSHMPNNIIVDRCYFMGDPVWGQKRAIYMNCKAGTVINSYFKDIWAVGQDSNCVAGVNGTGPYTVHNNYLEGAAENIIFGGDDPVIKTATTVLSSPAPTTISARLASTADLTIGQWIAFLSNGGTQRRHTTVRTINAGTGDITFDALENATVPDAPGDARWGTNITGISIRRNHMTKPVEWRNPILDTPDVDPLIVISGSGTLATGTYVYRVQAIRTGGYENSTYYSDDSVPQNAVLDAVGSVSLEWAAVANASRYRIWRQSPDATLAYFETTSLAFTDTGAAGTAGSIPGPTRRVVKNLCQLKTGIDVQIDSNVMEYSWKGSDIGQAIWIKTSNPSGGIEHNLTRNVVIERNIFRHVAGWLNISGIDVNSTRTPADWPWPTDNCTLRNNLVFDSQDPWTESTSVWGIAFNNGSVNTLIDHNTVIHQRYGMISLVKRSGLPDRYHINLVMRNNLMKGNTYPIKGGSAPNTGAGSAAFNAHTNNTGVFERNALSGIPSNVVSQYPPNNIYPTNAAFDAAFVNFDGGVNGDYHLKTTSEGDIFRGQGTDGLDLGCNVDLVLSSTYGVVEGIPEDTDPPPVDPDDLGGTLVMLTPAHAVPAPSSNAELDIRNGHIVLAFDSAVTETVYFSAVMPRFYNGNGCRVLLVWVAASETDPSNACVWEAAFDRYGEAGASLDTTTEAIAKTVTAQPPIQPGVEVYSQIQFSLSEVDGILPGEMFRLRISRTPGAALDQMTGDAQLLRVEIRTN